MPLDLINLLFWLHDAQVGIAAQIKDAKLRHDVKFRFNTLWTHTRALKRWVNQATSEIEKEHGHPDGIIDESFGDASEFIVLAVEAKLNADRLGIGNALIKTLENFRDEH